jgi:uncharacterized small protein (DUF1192 family)
MMARKPRQSRQERDLQEMKEELCYRREAYEGDAYVTYGDIDSDWLARVTMAEDKAGIEALMEEISKLKAKMGKGKASETV